MGGWELLPSVVPTYYDFLARGISDFDGTPLNTEGYIDAAGTYTHSDKVSLARVRDKTRLAVIAMLINDRTARIENAVRIPISDIDAVNEISATDFPVEYYDLSGRRLSAPPASGIYILRQGSNSRKLTAAPR